MNYQGRTIRFDPEYHRKLLESFQAGLYDQVPFQLADSANRHTHDPERWRGEVKGLELASDGLYATVELTEDAAELVRANPKLGVSCRIVESDGRPQLAHVLGTLDPRVTGMKPWEAVELAAPAGDPNQTLDLTSETYNEGGTVSEPNQPEQDEGRTQFVGTPTPAPSPAQSDQPARGEPAGEPDAGASTRERETEDVTSAEAELARLVDEEQQREIALARREQQESNERISALEAELARERFRRERDQLISEGVPPAMVELARPVLERPGETVIQLANSPHETVDVRAVVMGLLNEAKGTLELTREAGRYASEDEGDETENRLLASWNGGGV